MVSRILNGVCNNKSLQLVCDDADAYPQNLAPKYGSRKLLKEEGEKLHAERERLFDDHRESCKFSMTEVLSGSHAHCDSSNNVGEGNLANCWVLQDVPRQRTPSCLYAQPYRGPCMQNYAFKDLNELKEHLELPLKHKMKDASFRHMFISAKSNRSPLGCSASMFKYACSYQEVSPAFLKLIHRLGDQLSKPQSRQAGGYFEELYTSSSPDVAAVRRAQILCPASDYSFNDGINASLTKGDTPEPELAALGGPHHQVVGSPSVAPGYKGPLPMPQFDRSDRQLRIFYQLNAMEKSPSDQWSMRQTTVYYSFDFKFVKTFWMTIKADDEMRQRFAEHHDVEMSGRSEQTENLQETDRALNTSLFHHLIHLEWCAEGWRDYIDSREIDIRQIVNKCESVALKSIADNRTGLERGNTFHTIRPDEKIEPASRLGSWLSGTTKHSAADKAAADFTRPQEEIEREASQAFKNLQSRNEVFKYAEDVLETFSISGYQKLTAHATMFQDTKLALESNIDVLGSICKTYTGILSLDECPTDIKIGSHSAIKLFERRVTALRNELEACHRRVNSLLDLIHDGRPLYESILQFRNLERSTLMTLSSNYASLRMEATSLRTQEVGERTERITSSMHVITFFTLLLLPGTFLGSLFSTDIISRDDSEVKVDGALGRLFLGICLPMMLCSLLLWGFYMYLRRRGVMRRRHSPAEV